MIQFGTDKTGFKSGNYYTSYVSPNPKFYTFNKWYGFEIYTPFWNHMQNKYQQVDCGVDCDYLGPKNLMMGFMVYIVLAALFGLVASLAYWSKEKYQYQRDLEQAVENAENIFNNEALLNE